MKTIKNWIAAIAMMWIGAAHAQPYNTGVGIRLAGFTTGITVKGFLNGANAIEGIAGFGHHSFVATGLYEHHIPISSASGLYIYPGFGAHIGFFGTNGTYWVYKNRGEHVYVTDEGSSAVVPGIDGVFGIEYKFAGAPLSLGLDLHPFIDFFDGASMYMDGGLSFRYVF